MKDLSYRQIHLDFHTSEKIPHIGEQFSKEQFQEALKVGHVDTINIFAKCHHGWAYHPSTANVVHPELKFDLFGDMLAAAREIGVDVQTYISAGLDEKIATKHPEWVFRHQDQKTTWVPDYLTAGYHLLCFNSPYLDMLLAQIEESLTNYQTDGLWLDIVGVRECYCQNCTSTLMAEGKDPRDKEAVRELAERVYKRYTTGVQEIVDRVRPGIRVFHNSGHIARGRRDLARRNTHLELESLPTGNYGYDHFPMSARYVETLDMQYLSMTGKFHTNWGEFGGFKHPNALRYEVAMAMLHGARCSVGDQMHPDGLMDMATYGLIGKAYAEVEAREAWCVDTSNIADIAFLSIESIQDSVTSLYGGPDGVDASDIGALRLLQEGHYLFDIVDLEADFTKYKVLILPDKVRVDERLEKKLKDYALAGGRTLATGESGLNEQNAFVLDFGCQYRGLNPSKPSYYVPDYNLPSLDRSAYVMYAQGHEVELTDGQVLGHVEKSYFNRDVMHFCSHMHTPPSREAAGPAMIKGRDGIYFGWQVFEDYGIMGSVYMKESIYHALDLLLEDNKTLITDIPSGGRVSLRYNEAHNRYVNHLVYATPVKRGNGKEVVEDIVPIYQTHVKVKCEQPIKNVYLAPEMETIEYVQGEGYVSYTVNTINCHQMVILEVNG